MPKALLHRYVPYFLLLLSAMLHAFSFSPANIWPVGFLSIVPLLHVAINDLPAFNKKGIKTAIWYGFVMGLFFNTLNSYWLIDTIAIFGQLPRPIAVIFFLGYSIISCSRFVLFFLLFSLWKQYIENSQSRGFATRLLKKRYFAWPFFWGLSELLGWQLFPVLGANIVGGNLLFMQFSDIVGIRAVSVLWFIANLSLYDLGRTLFSKETSSPPWMRLKNAFIAKENRAAIAGVALLLFMHAYGLWALSFWGKQKQNYTVKNIGFVQGNTPLSIEAFRDFKRMMITINKTMTNESIRLIEETQAKGIDLDLLIWPESAIPFLSYRNHKIFQESVAMVQDVYPVEMILNDIDPVATGGSYNNLWHLLPGGIPGKNYHKILLLPFGEFIPLKFLVPDSIVNHFSTIANFHVGETTETINTKAGIIIPSICYELLPPAFTYNFFKKSGKKANLIVNITNDTWFGDSIEPWQHLIASRVRAIELRLPIIRSTNSGISAYIDTTGKLHNPTGVLTRQRRHYEVHVPDKSRSLFAIWGLWPFYIFIAASAAPGIWAFIENGFLTGIFKKKQASKKEA